MRTAYPLIVVVCLLLVIGCQSPQLTPVPNVSPFESPLSSGGVAPALLIPSPKSGTGIVHGTVLVSNTQQPMNGVGLYLGQHIGSTGDTPLFGVDPQTAPWTESDDYGRFVFADVLPGEYVLVLWTPHQSIMVNDPTTGDTRRFAVAEGQTLDLGTIVAARP